MKNLDDWTFVAAPYRRRRKFIHPITRNEVFFENLPAQEQQKLRPQLQQQEMMPHDSQPPTVDEGGGMADMGVSDLGGGDMGGGDGGAMASDLEIPSDVMLDDGLDQTMGQGGLGITPVIPMTFRRVPESLEGFEKYDDERMALMPGGPESLMADVPPPPATVRRQVQERMRELGRGLVVAGAKSPRQQMMEIQNAMLGMLDVLEALSDEPGREALRRRVLLQLRPRVMKF